MRGRKPVPTVLTKLHGNPGDRPLPKGIPEPTGALTDVPEWMTPGQVANWRYAIENSPPGLLKLIDRGVLIAWVVAEDIHRQACIEQAKIQLVVKMADNPMPMQSPYLPIINRQALIMMRAASELGFSPTARPRIHDNPIDDEINARRNTGTANSQESLQSWLDNSPEATSIH